ncbi:unnamed protein product [Adineta ricciae]|uniref:EF-hand domain-containing protein n=1 Tax=Adineta ricciae TaxID=249248 RepID=A0A816HAE5_ADIRI|nr:unnamed protein product [Adineta ricciae]
MRTNSFAVEHENKLKEAFSLFDRLGGGLISTKDLAFVMHSIGYQTTPSELECMIREVDQDGLLNQFDSDDILTYVLGNGLIDFDEFKTMMNRKGTNGLETFNDELLNEAFRIFDKNGDGLISEMEIRLVMNDLGIGFRACFTYLMTFFHIQARK